MIIKSYKSKTLKSLSKLVKFYRIFGFSFSDMTFNDKETKLTKIKRYFLIGYNLLVIMVFIYIQIVATPKILNEFKRNNQKNVLNAVLITGRLIACADIIFGYIISLSIGKKILKTFNTDEFREIDCNTKTANKILVLLVTLLMIFGTSSSVVTGVIKNNFTFGLPSGLTIIITFLATFFFFNGLLLLPVIYYYSTSLIIGRINRLNSGLTDSLNLKNICLKTYF